MIKFTTQLRHHHQAFYIDGFILAIFLIFERVVNTVEASPRLRERCYEQSQRLLSGLLRAKQEDAVMTLEEFLQKGISDSLSPELQTAAEELHAEGDKILNSAQEQESTILGDYCEKLYLAMPYFIASRTIYQHLVNANHPFSSSEDRHKSWARDLNATEEKLVRILNSLWNNALVARSNREVLANQRREVQEVRKTKGDTAAKQMVTEYIKLLLYYPNSYRSFFLQDNKQ